MKADPVSLVAGLAAVVAGALVLMDSSGAVDVSFGWTMVVLTAAAGLVFLVSGLSGSGGARHD